jgi:hypothetical protein
MEIKSLKLDSENYHRYVNGSEVTCIPRTGKADFLPGEHVMVYKDTVATNSAAGVPKGEYLTENIGVEGMVVAVGSERPGVIVKKI